MAVNDFWRFLSRDMTETEIAAGKYINPLLFETALLDVASADTGGITLAQLRTFFGLTVGTSQGDEFTDLLTSLGTIPGTAGFTGTKLVLQERVMTRIVRFAVLGGRQARIPSNPYNTGNELRLRAKALITTAGGTPSGTLAA